MRRASSSRLGGIVSSSSSRASIAFTFAGGRSVVSLTAVTTPPSLRPWKLTRTRLPGRAVDARGQRVGELAPQRQVQRHLHVGARRWIGIGEELAHGPGQ
jgi:hypothetical protein